MFYCFVECGAGFTSKLEGMFKDIDISKDIMVSFKQHMESREAPGGMDMTVNVLMLSYWPTYPAMPVNLLPEVLSLYLHLCLVKVKLHLIVSTCIS